MFLSGQAGVGKTHVYRAFNALSMSWNASALVQCIAPTGIAAANAGGCTIHSFLCLGQSTNFSEKSLSNRFALYSVYPQLMIVDEISMVSPDLLGTLSDALDFIYRPIKRKCLGGLQAVLSGDFHQLQPVRSKSLADKKDSKSARGNIGTQIWRQDINTSVVLSQQMRQHSDQQWASDLKLIRDGNITKDVIAHLNARALTSASTIDSLLPGRKKGELVRVVCWRNGEVNSINQKCIASIAYSGPTTVYRLLAIVTESDSNGRIPIEVRQALGVHTQRQCSESIKLHEHIDIFIGMPIMVVSCNPAVGLGIYNGTFGTVVGFAWPEGKEPSFSRFSVTDHASEGMPHDVLLPSLSPVAVYIYVDPIHNSAGSFRIQGLPDNVYPIVLRPSTVSIKVDGRQWKVRIRQFSLVAAFAVTGHKYQGMSADKLVVHLPSSLSDRGHIPPQWLYMVLSRVRSSAGLVITTTLTEKDAAHFVPSKNCIDEDNRFDAMTEETYNIARALLGESVTAAIVSSTCTAASAPCIAGPLLPQITSPTAAGCATPPLAHTSAFPMLPQVPVAVSLLPLYPVAVLTIPAVLPIYSLLRPPEPTLYGIQRRFLPDNSYSSCHLDSFAVGLYSAVAISMPELFQTPLVNPMLTVQDALFNWLRIIYQRQGLSAAFRANLREACESFQHDKLVRKLRLQQLQTDELEPPKLRHDDSGAISEWVRAFGTCSPFTFTKVSDYTCPVGHGRRSFRQSFCLSDAYDTDPVLNLQRILEHDFDSSTVINCDALVDDTGQKCLAPGFDKEFRLLDDPPPFVYIENDVVPATIILSTSRVNLSTTVNTPGWSSTYRLAAAFLFNLNAHHWTAFFPDEYSWIVYDDASDRLYRLPSDPPRTATSILFVLVSKVRRSLNSTQAFPAGGLSGSLPLQT